MRFGHFLVWLRARFRKLVRYDSERKSEAKPYVTMDRDHRNIDREPSMNPKNKIMHIQDIFSAHRTTFSFEFFPPKTDAAWEELFVTIAHLQELQPSFVSVTYGAGGSTREKTHELIVRIQRETNLTAVSHLTSVCHTRDELAAILDRYAEAGIANILALGGDPPKNLAN